jgi:hypothetical protein
VFEVVLNILLAFHDSQAKVVPLDYLGSEDFTLFRNACSASGCSSKKLSEDKWITLVRIDFVPALIDRLRSAGFTVAVSPELAAAAAARARQIALDRSQAHRRLSAMDCRPYPYQEVGIKVLAAHDTFLFADAPRLGKSVQSLLSVPDGAGVIVLCQAKIDVRGSWVKNVLQWRPGLIPEKDRAAWDLAAKTGKFKKIPQVLERFRWPRPNEIVIINYERQPVPDKELEDRGPKASDVLLSQAPIPDHRIVLLGDELHHMKSSKSIRTKRFRALAKIVRGAGGITWGLTGTPLRKNPMDLLNVLQALDLLKDSFGSYPNFLRLMRAKKKYFGGFSFGDPMPQAVECLKRVMLRRTWDEVLPDMPPVQFNVIDVELSKEAKVADYEASEAIRAAGVDLAEVVAGNQTLGAAQDCVFRARRILAESLVPATLEIVDDYLESETPLVVFSAHRAPIEAIAKRPGCCAVLGGQSEESSAAHDFETGKYGVIGLTIQSGAMALTLFRSDYVLMVDEAWTVDDNEQAYNRVRNTEKSNPISVDRFRVAGSVCERVHEILERDQKIISSVIDSTHGETHEIDLDRLANLGGI